MIGGAIATAARLARHDGRPERVFGASIGGLERRVEEEAEDGAESLDIVLTGDGQAVARVMCT